MSSVCKNEFFQYTAGQLKGLRKTFNSWFPYEPIVLIGGAVLVTHGAHWIYDSIPNDGVTEGLKRFFFRNVRKIPIVKRKIDEEIGKTDLALQKDINALFKVKDSEDDEIHYITKLPCNGLSDDEILQKLTEYMDLATFSWQDGTVSGTVYHGGKDVTNLYTKVYEMTQWSNPLHPDVFPGVCKMEAEIVRIVAELFHGGPDTCGTVTSGGTESLLLAVKAYKDYAIEVRGITHPEILCPVSAHAAFDKAAQLMGIGVKHAPLLKNKYIADVRAMERMITKRTCMLVASAPPFPHGCIDDVEAIAKLGLKYNIPVHVDACLGGFLIAFMAKAGFPLKPFDFQVPGVTSISADSHKYGCAPKGSSILLFSDIKYKHHQYFMQPNWPGGLYASPTLAGSRPGALIAGCWASLLTFGMKGYVENTKKIITCARYIKSRLSKIKEIEIMGDPEVSVIAMTSSVFNIYQFQDAMNTKGWRLNALQFPPGLHFAVTYAHLQPGHAEKFCKDAEDIVECIMKNPDAPVKGVAAIYGTSQQIPDRSIVSELTAMYLDKLYMTDYEMKHKSSSSKNKRKK